MPDDVAVPGRVPYAATREFVLSEPGVADPVTGAGSLGLGRRARTPHRLRGKYCGLGDDYYCYCVKTAHCEALGI